MCNHVDPIKTLIKYNQISRFLDKLIVSKLLKNLYCDKCKKRPSSIRIVDRELTWDTCEQNYKRYCIAIPVIKENVVVCGFCGKEIVNEAELIDMINQIKK